MSRIILNYLLPLIVPTAAYLAWVWYFRRRAETTGDEPPEITRGGLFWSLVLGLALVIAGLVGLAVTAGVKPGEGGYQSPRIEDGRVIPPTFK